MTFNPDGDDIDWKKLVTRPMSTFVMDLIFRGLSEEFPKVVDVNRNLKAAIHGEEGELYIDPTSIRGLEEFLREKFNSDKSFFKKHLKEGRKISEELLDLSEKINGLNLTEDEELLNYFEEYENTFYRFTPFLHTVLGVESILTDYLKGLIRVEFSDADEDELERYFRILTTIQEESDYYREQKELFEIVIAMKEGKDIEDRLEDHVEKFGYMGLTNHPLSELYDVQHFKELISGIENPEESLEELIEKRKEEKSKYNEIVDDLSGEILDTVKLLQDYMSFRDERIAIMKKSLYNIRPLLREITNRFDVSLENIVCYRVRELKDLIRKERKTDVSRRRNQFTLKLLDGKVYHSHETNSMESDDNLDILNGTVAYEGNVSGEARIVLSAEDVEKVSDGDILVSPMTTPDLMSAIKSAGAIVTDEGGIACHAAIVSRELKIPCVIGTKIATEILSDGDAIKIDANEGAIEKINEDD